MADINFTMKLLLLENNVYLLFNSNSNIFESLKNDNYINLKVVAYSFKI